MAKTTADDPDVSEVYWIVRSGSSGFPIYLTNHQAFSGSRKDAGRFADRTAAIGQLRWVRNIAQHLRGSEGTYREVVAHSRLVRVTRYRLAPAVRALGLALKQLMEARAAKAKGLFEGRLPITEAEWAIEVSRVRLDDLALRMATKGKKQ